MRIYEGSPRQDFEEVFRSIGAFLDQRGMRDVLLLEAPDGFIVQGLVSSGAAPGLVRVDGTAGKETLTFLDDDIARFMDEARRPSRDRRARPARPVTTRRRSGSSAGTWTTRSRATSSSSSRTAPSSCAC